MIYIANDHGGVQLKYKILKYLKKINCDVKNLGTDSEQSVNYAEFAKTLTNRVLESDQNFGILICRSGLGMSIAANRVKKIRACLCLNPKMAKLSRNHNNANVLVLSANTLRYKKIVKTFLTEKFDGGRHIARVESLDKD